MDKGKQIKIAIIAVIVLLVIIGSVFLIKNINSSNSTQRTEKLYQQVSNANQITFTCTLDNNNKETIIIKDDKAYKEVIKDGEKSTYIVKDGNTYFLDADSKKYYTYQNNTAILIELKQQLGELQNITKTT